MTDQVSNMTENDINRLGQILSKSITSNNSSIENEIRAMANETKKNSESLQTMALTFTEYMTENKHLVKKVDDMGDELNWVKSQQEELSKVVNAIVTEKQVKAKFWKAVSDNWWKVLMLTGFLFSVFYMVQSTYEATQKQSQQTTTSD